MITREIRLEGGAAGERQVDAAVLRHTLASVIEGSQQALRIRAEGRSTAPGSLPSWIVAATRLSVEVAEGSTVLRIEAPSLLEAAPDEFRQQSLFGGLDPMIPAVDLLAESFAAAIEGDHRADLYDGPLLETFQSLDRIFRNGVREFTFTGADDRRGVPALRIAPEALPPLRSLEERIPRPQAVRVLGRLDTIRHSDRTFVLWLEPERGRIRGIANSAEDLKRNFGAPTLVSGLAHFTATGAAQWIEAESIRPASEREQAIFGTSPTPISATLRASDVRRPQGPRSGLNAIFGRWPGEETGEEIRAALDRLS
jgi:hypothetical protein